MQPGTESSGVIFPHMNIIHYLNAITPEDDANIYDTIFSRENRYNIYLVSILLKKRSYQLPFCIIMKALSTKVICHNKLG